VHYLLYGLVVDNRFTAQRGKFEILQMFQAANDLNRPDVIIA
jgi:hypothetical protein